MPICSRRIAKSGEKGQCGLDLAIQAEQGGQMRLSYNCRGLSFSWAVKPTIITNLHQEQTGLETDKTLCPVVQFWLLVYNLRLEQDRGGDCEYRLGGTK